MCGHEGPLFPAGGRAAGAGPPFTSRAVPGPGRTPPPTSGGCVGGRAGPGQPAATPGAVSALPRRKGPLSSRGHPPLPPPSGPTSRGLCGMLCPCCGICASVWGLEGDYYSYLLLIIIYSPPPPRGAELPKDRAARPGRPRPRRCSARPSPGPPAWLLPGCLNSGRCIVVPPLSRLSLLFRLFLLLLLFIPPPSPTLPRREVIQTPSCPIRPKRRRLPRVGQVEPGAGWGWGGGDKSIDKPEICWK